MKTLIAILTLCLAGAACVPAQAADAERQAEVARRGTDVMPFDRVATLHVFTKTPEGGVQRVVARRAGDATQVRLVRRHLREIRAQFLKGDFSAPAHIHGDAMPGLAALQAAGPGKIAIDYREVSAGAQLTYRTKDENLAQALHEWFDAQLSDHGADAMAGSMHHGDHGSMTQK